MYRRAITCVVGALLSSCGGTPVDFIGGSKVPANRIADRSLVDPSPGSRPITIGRDDDGILDARFYVDGKLVANLASGEVLVIYLTPGEHLLGVKKRVGIGAPQVQEIPVDVGRSKFIRYRIFGDSSGFNIQPAM